MVSKKKLVADLEATLDTVRAETAKHDAESHRQIAVQAAVIGALFLATKGSRRRVVLAKNILTKGAALVLDATVDKDGNLILAIRPTPKAEEVVAE